MQVLDQQHDVQIERMLDGSVSAAAAGIATMLVLDAVLEYSFQSTCAQPARVRLQCSTYVELEYTTFNLSLIHI